MEDQHEVFRQGALGGSSGQESDIAPHLALPKDFIHRRSDLAIVMSDQVPIWIKIGHPKVVFSEFEHVADSKQSRKFKEGAEVMMRTSDRQVSQRLSSRFTHVPSKVAELMEKQAA